MPKKHEPPLMESPSLDFLSSDEPLARGGGGLRYVLYNTYAVISNYNCARAKMQLPLDC